MRCGHKYNMKFRQFFENSFRKGAKLGLYPPLEDALGQYPPLYGTARAADLITYIDIEFGGKIPGKDGIIRYTGRRKHRH